MLTILGWGKEISNTVKIYTEELKYNSINGSFNYKLIIFYNIYNQSNVLQEAYNKALPIILIGLALNQYFNIGLSNLLFKDAYRHLRGFFKGPSSKHKNLNKWNTISLKTIMDKNADKSTSDCLQILIDTLSQLQHSLTPKLQT